MLKAAATRVEPGRVTYTDADGEHVLECRSIILSGAVRVEDDKLMAFRDCALEVVTAGDCCRIGSLDTVNFTAYSAACRL